MITLNLTQHMATDEQQCFEPVRKDLVQEALTFAELPTAQEVKERAKELAQLAANEVSTHSNFHAVGWDEYEKAEDASRIYGETRVMIGGAPFLMPALEAALKYRGLKPVYAFSQRESVDQEQPDGSVRKVAVFRHLGFIEA